MEDVSKDSASGVSETMQIYQTTMDKSLPGINFGPCGQEDPEFGSDDPATPAHVWPDTDEEWNDEYCHQLFHPVNPLWDGAQRGLQTHAPPDQAPCGRMPLCFHLAVSVLPHSPSYPPRQGTTSQICPNPVAQVFGKESITPVSQSTTLDFSATTSIDSESDCESLAKTEKLGKDDVARSENIPFSPEENGSRLPSPKNAKSKRPTIVVAESPLKQAMRTGELALRKARALGAPEPKPAAEVPQPKPKIRQQRKGSLV
eukprot:Skav200853  [mRNA]  locus=scaffold2484:95741:96514:+ [translate_table: standard]